MVEISLSGSGEGSGWVTAPGYSTKPTYALRRGVGWWDDNALMTLTSARATMLARSRALGANTP